LKYENQVSISSTLHEASFYKKLQSQTEI